MSRILKYNEAKFKILQYAQDNNLGVNDKLPSEKELAEKLGFSIVPVRHALDNLVKLQIIKKIHGVGNFICKDISKNKELKFNLAAIAVDSLDEFAGVDRQALQTSVQSRNGSYEVIYVSREPDNSVVEHLRDFDRFLITGHVNEFWVDCVRSLGKPLIQIGNSSYSGPICRVDFDWASAFNISLKELKRSKAKNIAIVLPDSDHISYSKNIADIFTEEKKKLGFSVSSKDIFMPKLDREIQAMGEFAKLQDEEYDAIYVEFSILWTFLLHYWREPHLRTRKVILLDSSFSLKQDLEILPRWGIIRFKDSPVGKGINLILDADTAFFENDRSTLLEPTFTGDVFRNINRK